MTQQYGVRCCLYTHLENIFISQQSLRSHIFDLLLPQFFRYYEADESIAVPINVDVCAYHMFICVCMCVYVCLCVCVLCYVCKCMYVCVCVFNQNVRRSA